MPIAMPDHASHEVTIQRMSATGIEAAQDALAVEEPLEIRVGFWREGRRETRPISITMRTPGHDLELAVGFLFTEGLITGREDIFSVQHCGLPVSGAAETNTVRVDLRPNVAIDLTRLERHFYTTSSCGVCGKTSIEALQAGRPLTPMEDALQVTEEVILRLPPTLRAAQSVFDATGGLHAAALFDTNGNLLALREDVGRHNALDKLIGASVGAGETPLRDRLLLVSGRASFELVQKALMANIPVLAAVGAPSSLAVELANQFGMTLAGFVRERRFNIYCGPQRIAVRPSRVSGEE